MEKLKRLINIGLVCFLLVTSFVTWQTWGDEKGKASQKEFYIVTLDGNGGTITISGEPEERLLEKGIEIIDTKASLKQISDYNVASESDAKEDMAIASESNAEEDSVLFSDFDRMADTMLATVSNSRTREFVDREFTKLQLKVPVEIEGEELTWIIAEFYSSHPSNRAFSCGWSTVKDDVTTCVTRDAMLGGIGIKKPLALNSDITLYAILLKDVFTYMDNNQETWGYQIMAHATLNNSGTICGNILNPSMDLEEMTKALEQMSVVDFNYDYTFQVDFSGLEGSSVGIFLNIIGDKSLPVNIYRLDSSGKAIIEEVKYVYSEYGDDSGRTGNNASFMINKNVSYLVVPSMRLLDVSIENVKGGFVSALASIPNMDGDYIEAYLPVGEISKVPMGTKLYMEINTYNEMYLLGISDAEQDQLDQHMVDTRLKNYIVTDKNGESITLNPDTWEYTVSDDVSITAVFEEDKDTSSGHAKDSLYVGLSKNRYSENEKVDSEVFVYKWKKENRVEVQNLALCAEDRDNESFYLENGRLKSTEILACDNYSVSFEFDYEGKHYSGSTSDVDERGGRLWSSVMVGNQAVFYASGIRASFNNKEYYTDGMWAYGGDVIYASPNASFKDLSAQIDMDSLPIFLNYSFAGWYGLDGKAIPEDKKLGNGLDAIGKYINAEGKEYNLVVYPLYEFSGEEDDPVSDDTDDDNDSEQNSSGTALEMQGQWKQAGDGWRFKKSNGSYAKNEWGMINGTWYYFGENTNMVSNWITWNGDWYFLDPLTGAMKTGWLQMDGKWYYLNPNSDGTKGRMMKNQWIGSYYVDENGAWIEGAK